MGFNMQAWDNWNPMFDAYHDPNFNSYHRHSSNNDTRHPTTSLYVARIPRNLENDAFFDIFKRFGRLQSATKMNVNQASDTTYGFLNYHTKEDALAALSRMNGVDIYGMRVSLARSKSSQPQDSEAKPSSSTGKPAEHSNQLKPALCSPMGDVYGHSKKEVNDSKSLHNTAGSKLNNLNDPAILSVSVTDEQDSVNTNGPALEVAEQKCSICGNSTHLRCTECKAYICTAKCSSSRSHIDKCAVEKRSGNMSENKYEIRMEAKYQKDGPRDEVNNLSPQNERKEGFHSSKYGNDGADTKKSPRDPYLNVQRTNAYMEQTHKRNFNEHSERSHQKDDSYIPQNDRPVGNFKPKRSPKKKVYPPSKNNSDMENQDMPSNRNRENCNNTFKQKSDTNNFKPPTVSTESNFNSNILVQVKADASKMDSLPMKLEENEKVKVCYVSNPHEFWVQRLKDFDTLIQIQRDLATLKLQNSLFHNPAVNDLCGSIFDEDQALYRSKITKVLGNDTCEVKYIDFGNSSIVSNSLLCHLPPKLVSHPPMAFCCQLSEVNPPQNQWNTEEISFFQQVVEAKFLLVLLLDDKVSPTAIDLRNENDVHVSDLLVNDKKARWFKDCKVKISEIPSVLDGLGVQTYLKFKSLSGNGNHFFFWVENVRDVMSSFIELERRLQHRTKKDITTKVDENDICVSYCDTSKLWCRTYVMKKTSESFFVRFIDYGTVGDVKKLYYLEPEDRKVSSPLVCLEKPKHIQTVDFQKRVLNGFRAVINSVLATYFELQFTTGGLRVHSFPWTYKLGSLKGSSNKDERKFEKQAAVIGSVNANKSILTPSPGFPLVSPHLKLSKSILNDRPLLKSDKVIVCYCKSAKNVYVQRCSDMAEFEKLNVELNSWCNALSGGPRHLAAEDEVVCAKFSEDNSWYRSLIIKTLPGKKYKVFFIDYGNYEEVLFSDIKELNPEHSAPKYCICVSLVSSMHHIPNEKVSELLLFTGKPLDLVVVDSSVTPPLVEFYDNGRNIFDQILQAKNPASETSEPVDLVIPKMEVIADPIEHYDETDVKVLNIDSLNHFNVQFLDRYDQFQEMQLQLNDICTDSVAKQGNYSYGTQDVVCVKHNKEWFRACVLQTSGSSCELSLFDVGSIVKCFTKDVMPFPLKSVLPRFSHNVALAGVSKEYLTDDVLESICGHEFTLKLVDKQAVPMTVQLYQGTLCVNDILTREPEVQPTTGIVEACIPPPVPSMNYLPVKENKAVTEPLSCCEDLPLVKFPEGSSKIILYHVESVVEIFCAPFENITANMALVNEITQHCKEQDTTPYCPVQDGELILAKFEESWYRALVGAKNSLTCFIQFIDFGNMAEVEYHNIRKMDNKFMKLPIQAHVGKLDGCSKDSDPNVLQAFRQFTQKTEDVVDAIVTRDKDDFFILDIPEWKAASRQIRF